MGQITSLFVHKVVAAAVQGDGLGATQRKELLNLVGIDSEVPIDPKLMISDTDYYEFCERVFYSLKNRHSLTVRVGSSMRCDDYGAFGLAWKSATTLQGSFDRAERYALVLTNVSTYELSKEAGKRFMKLHREGDRSQLGLRLSNEQTLVAVTQISREVSTAEFSPQVVYFKHESPEDASALEAYFGCPVYFGADLDALQVSETSLQTPNKLGDSKFSEFFESHMVQELSDMQDKLELDQLVRTEICKALSEGVPTISDVASGIGMSARTLQRRLAERGYSYQDLVDGARRELSERLLSTTEYALAEIAFLTGFSEQSAFNRAFKRWSSQTPRSFRLNLRN